MWDAEPLAAAGVQQLVIGLGGDGRYDLGPLRELVVWRDAQFTPA